MFETSFYCAKCLSNFCYDFTFFVLDQLFQLRLNKAINLRPLTPHITSCYTTKWRSFCNHRLCDVNAMQTYLSLALQTVQITYNNQIYV